MKKSILALAACTILAGTMLTGCNSSSEKVHNAQDNIVKANQDLEQANKEYLADVENYKKETAAMIAANDQIIADLKATIQHDKKTAKADYKSKVAALEQKNAEMKKKMEDYRQDGKDKWQAFKAEFSHDMDELGKAFKDLHASSMGACRV